MKSNFFKPILLLFFFSLNFYGNAQIIKPGVKLNTNKVNSDKFTKGLKINSLSNLKSIADFKKLNIPVQQITKEQLNKKNTETWIINPRKINQGSLKLDVFNGMTRQDSWTYGGSLDENLDRILERLNNGRNSHRGQSHIWPIQVKFRVSGGIEYRLKFKEKYSTEETNNKYIYVNRNSKNGSYISRVNMNEFGEFNYIIKEPNSGEIELQFTAIPELRESHISSSRENRNNWNWVSISEIRIDRID